MEDGGESEDERLSMGESVYFEVFNDDYQQLPPHVVTARAMNSAKWVMEKALRRYLPLPKA